MKYKSNFLKNVIFRLDFDEVGNRSLTSDDQLFTEYGTPTNKHIMQVHFSVSPDGEKTIKEEKINLIEFQHHNNQNKVVTLMKNALIVECKNSEYKDFITLRDEINLIFSEFQKKYSIKQFNRIGLRYINEIFIPGKHPLKWDGYIDDNLCKAIMANILGDSKPVRSMHQIEIKRDEVGILFNYGLFNKDYPNPIARPELILDYDYFINSLLETNEILDKLGHLNTLAEDMFESSIGDELRKKMEHIHE